MNPDPRQFHTLGLEELGTSPGSLGVSPHNDASDSSPSLSGEGPFSRYGVEIEYAVVDKDSLDVRPVVDELFDQVSGSYDAFEHDDITWSNELVGHVLKLRLTEPSVSLEGIAERFQGDVQYANAKLAGLDCRLLPTGMHPWMEPSAETVLWKHRDREVCEAYNRIFNCRRHGWANVQSAQLILPFANDEEFRRLHSAIRLLLPLMPALAASSPYAESSATGSLDTRMKVRRTNSEAIPSMAGHFVPELILNRSQYEQEILHRVYRDILPHDPDHVLGNRWVNARGAIARFEHNTIEIRTLDAQECPAADLAIFQFIVAVLKRLVDESICPLEHQEEASLLRLAMEFRNVVRTGRSAEITDKMMLRAFGHPDAEGITAGQIWTELLERIPVDESAAWRGPIEMILCEGCLAERIVRAGGAHPDVGSLREFYQKLATCLARGQMFE